MRLELVSFPVREMSFGARTQYHEGRLSIQREEILQLLKQDKRIAQAAIEIVDPGDEVRIVSIRDVVEPRVKAS